MGTDRGSQLFQMSQVQWENSSKKNKKEIRWRDIEEDAQCWPAASTFIHTWEYVCICILFLPFHTSVYVCTHTYPHYTNIHNKQAKTRKRRMRNFWVSKAVYSSHSGAKWGFKTWSFFLLGTVFKEQISSVEGLPFLRHIQVCVSKWNRIPKSLLTEEVTMTHNQH